MNISFIGAGKVGISLGIYLEKNNFNILGYYSKTFSSSLTAGNLTNSEAFRTIDESLNADIIFITVNDDAIKAVANEIFELHIDYRNKTFIHMSGALSSSELEILKNKTSYIVSLHPIQAFPDIDNSVKHLEDTVFSIEGNIECIESIKNILDICGNKYFLLKENQKLLYHASACVLSNYLVTLLDYGFSILKHIGIPEELAMTSFFPLIEASINNVKESNPQNALTGPISRGDINTVKKHLEAFNINGFDDTNLYKVMGSSTLHLAEKNKLKDRDIALKILELLGDKKDD